MKTSRWMTRAVLAAAVLIAVPACAAGRNASVTAFHPREVAHSKYVANKPALLYPSHKYYGMFTPSAPYDMTQVDQVTTETGKHPNLSLYFSAWNSTAKTASTNFSSVPAENACAAGMLPMLTWESWDTADRGPNTHNGTSYGNGVKWDQPDFSPAKIASGAYDPYIKATAKAIKKLPCPIALRFDQEVNGYWYPWGAGNPDMGGTMASRATDYVAMWRHVWRVFHNAGVKNVLWVWSPNIQSATHPSEPSLTDVYPGDKYVDWVGIDGYYYNATAGTSNNQTFNDVFKPTITQVRAAAPSKPWIIAETGVAAGDHKTSEITNLINAVANRHKFNGFVYFDQFKNGDRSDWRFDAPGDTADIDAFKAAVANDVYASAKAGSFSGTH